MDDTTIEKKAAEQKAVLRESIEQTVKPISNSHRQTSLDFIRGIAVFGILIMNIQTFGNVFASYVNPTVNGDFSGLNVIAWFTTHIFFEQKFYTIFSMLFGAGIVLMAEKARAKGRSAARFHYSRSVLLIIFGLCHGFFIWFGDILTAYGIFALFVYLALDARPWGLVISGVLLSLLVSSMMMLGYFVELPPEQVQQMENMYIPSQEIIQNEVTGYLGNWSENQATRVKAMGMMLSFIFIFGIRIAGCMLIGMALFKWGIINGKRDSGFYKKLTFICLIPGLFVTAYGANLLYLEGFTDAIKAQSLLAQINFLMSIVVAIGYIGLFHWIYKGLNSEGIKKSIEAVGQMAFTNYITQSIICTFIFYGFGLGFFASLERYQLLLVAVAVLALQLVWSKWWLSRFNFGPLEWLWRTLTYFKLQPFKK